MKQKINISSFEKIYYGLMLIFCITILVFMIWKDGGIKYEINLINKQFILSIVFICLGIITVFKFLRHKKSIFIYTNLSIEKKVSLINTIAKKDHFIILPAEEKQVVKLNYQKNSLGLTYLIHFYINERYIEYNVFGNQLGLFDFGTRKRILDFIKKEIESNATFFSILFYNWSLSFNSCFK